MEKKYGLWTSIAMIVGIVIGSGIFFKADNILSATGGNVGLAVLALGVSAVSIIFGAMTVSRLAMLTDKSGGAIAYFEQFYSRPAGAGFGWFQTFVYFPSLVCVIAYVLGVYVCMLAGINDGYRYQALIGFAIMIAVYLINMTLPRLSGGVQIVCTVAKLIPLLLIAGFGLFAGEYGLNGAEIVKSVENTEPTGSFLSALLPVVFSYDGWIVATSISKEIKNEKRNLPLALLIAPAIVLVVYVAYFVGLVRMVGIAHILEYGDAYLYVASEKIFGPAGKTVMLIMVAISVFGTLNGLILGHIRLPQSLHERGFLGGDRYEKAVNSCGKMIFSGIIAILISLVWGVGHYLSLEFNLLPESDISELAIVSQYILFLALYVKVFLLWRKKVVKGVMYGVVCPLLASIGAIIICVCGFLNPVIFAIGLVLVAIVFASGYLFTNRKIKANTLIEYSEE